MGEGHLFLSFFPLWTIWIFILFFCCVCMYFLLLAIVYCSKYLFFSFCNMFHKNTRSWRKDKDCMFYSLFSSVTYCYSLVAEIVGYFKKNSSGQYSRTDENQDFQMLIFQGRQAFSTWCCTILSTFYSI